MFIRNTNAEEQGHTVDLKTLDPLHQSTTIIQAVLISNIGRLRADFPDS